VKFPTGLDEIKHVYGDPKALLRSDGMIHPSWERVTLDYVYLPEVLPLGWDRTILVSRIRVHKLLTFPLSALLKELHAAGHWDKLKTFDGSYAWRPSRGSQKLSTHCWGIALDFNAETNGLGEQGDMAPEVIEMFVRHGWEWGGEWHRPDPMHFQAAHGY
jgi:hypothetical protein